MIALFQKRYLLLLFLAGVLPACASSGYSVSRVPDNGYDRTLNYQFQAQVHADENGVCKQLVVRVKPINKIYWKEPPPDRLQLFDDDCLSPVRFERLQYLANDGLVRLSGVQITHFWSENFRMEDELVSWLWQKEII